MRLGIDGVLLAAFVIQATAASAKAIAQRLQAQRLPAPR